MVSFGSASDNSGGSFVKRRKMIFIFAIRLHYSIKNDFVRTPCTSLRKNNLNKILSYDFRLLKYIRFSPFYFLQELRKVAFLFEKISLKSTTLSGKTILFRRWTRTKGGRVWGIMYNDMEISSNLLFSPSFFPRCYAPFVYSPQDNDLIIYTVDRSFNNLRRLWGARG